MMTQRFFLAVTLVLGLDVSTAFTQTFTFQKVADNNTTVPGTATTYKFLGNPSYDGTNVAFVATSADSAPSNNVMSARISGQLVKIANLSTSVPAGTNAVFKSFSNYGIDAGVVVFMGSYLTQGEVVTDNVLLRYNGSLTNLADTDPGSEFLSVAFPSISQGVIANYAQSSVPQFDFGIYVGGSRVVDNMVNIPGTSTKFGNFGEPVIRNGNVVFYGAKDITYALPNGVFINGAGGLTTVIKSGDAIPGVADTFASINQVPSLSGTDGAFIGYGNTGGYTGVFARIGGTLKKIADTGTAIPGGTGNFTGFGNNLTPAVAIEQGQVLFVGYGNSFQSGLYLHNGTSLVKVVAEGDTLDGKTVIRIGSSAAIRILPTAFRNTSFAFYVEFGTGGSNDNAIYIGTIGGSTGGCGAKQLLDAAQTFVPVGPLLPSAIKPRRTAALDRSERSLDELRRFRDEVLQHSVIGRQLTATYYAHSPAVAKAAITRPDLLLESVRLLDEVAAAVAHRSEADRLVRLPKSTFDRGLRWLDSLESHLSDDDRAAIALARKQLVNRSQTVGDQVQIRFDDR